ncbi:glycosyltransferase [Phyllobacterium brassicacearum]|nr:glycosyltransferase [Phyllobacterium brassicacearum]TDQ31977.1 glycosyltransferase involved in cell wall biosynthesis [Phyllobacterium brassicacearum]
MIYADITEFVSNPVGTGIQRTVREIFLHWPDALMACYFDRTGNALRKLPTAAFASAFDDDITKSTEEKAANAAEIMARLPGELVSDDDLILIPEVFYDPSRIAFYRERLDANPAKTAAIVYDILPWTHPELFGIKDMSPFEAYFRLIFSMAYTAHISQETKESYERYAGSRPWPLPVLHLGADGIIIERQHFHPSRKSFVCLGSIEERKRQIDILRAFQRLWDTDVPAELVFVGRNTAHTNAALPRMVKELSASVPYFHHYESASDDEVAKLLSSARATIAASTVEGYGLPAIESLYAGIPVIVSETMPSTRRLPETGQIRFRPKSPDQIANAVKSMLDDAEAERVWKQAAAADLPVWRDTAMQVHDWIMQIWLTHQAIDTKRSFTAEKSAQQWLSEIAS